MKHSQEIELISSNEQVKSDHWLLSNNEVLVWLLLESKWQQVS